MLNRKDLEDMGYFEMFYDKCEEDPLMFYSTFVENKIITKGSDRLYENVLGLVGEAGEVAEKIKKRIRDYDRFSDEDMIKELGDVLFYTFALANLFKGSLRHVIEQNIRKLDSRQKRGKLQGSGDNR